MVVNAAHKPADGWAGVPQGRVRTPPPRKVQVGVRYGPSIDFLIKTAARNCRLCFTSGVVKRFIGARMTMMSFSLVRY